MTISNTNTFSQRTTQKEREKGANYLELDWRERRLKKYYLKSTLYDNLEKLTLRRKIELDVREYRERGLLNPDYYKRKRFHEGEEDYLIEGTVQE